MFLPAVVLATSLGLCLYAYVGYPAILKMLTLSRRFTPATRPRAWPLVSITIPVHNEAAVIADTLEQILALDYPAEGRQILVVSDASTDGTDEIVARFAPRGIELVRLPQRRGQTAGGKAPQPPPSPRHPGKNPRSRARGSGRGKKLRSA